MITLQVNVRLSKAMHVLPWHNLSSSTRGCNIHSFWCCMIQPHSANMTFNLTYSCFFYRIKRIKCMLNCIIMRFNLIMLIWKGSNMRDVCSELIFHNQFFRDSYNAFIFHIPNEINKLWHELGKQFPITNLIHGSLLIPNTIRLY
jgi:hypothetical protein